MSEPDRAAAAPTQKDQDVAIEDLTVAELDAGNVKGGAVIRKPGALTEEIEIVAEKTERS